MFFRKIPDNSWGFSGAFQVGWRFKELQGLSGELQSGRVVMTLMTLKRIQEEFTGDSGMLQESFIEDSTCFS